MKIKSISVTKLFGIFDHSIKFNEDITILIGENGLGKTVILEMLNNIFKQRFHSVSEVKFDKFNINFDNRVSWSFRVNEGRLQVRDSSKTSNLWKYLYNDQNKYEALKKKRSESIHQQNTSNKQNSNYSGHSDFDDLTDFFWQRMLIESKSKQKRNPTWFENIQDKIEIDLIETQRILTSYDDDNEKYRSTISDCAKSLQGKLKIYALESQKITAELDSSFPNRIIKSINSTSQLNYEDINKELFDINETWKQLTNVGLLTKLDIEEIQNLKNNDDSILNFINLYIQDSKKKLKPYDAIYDKLALFLNIANSRLKHKKLLACLEHGFKIQSTVLKDESGKAIEFHFNKLSSGEQHEIILFYKLIFLYEDNSLVLLDEPELSLHISWQNNFINDIKKIISYNNLIILIATHSPDIIGEHWHMTQELTGVED